jgi:hypothetical protein
MCCFVTALLLVGPRAGIVVWWLFNPNRFSAAFSSFIWPLLGFVFLPWTTLMYLLIWSPLVGITGFDWVWLGLGFLVDIVWYAGGGFSNRDRLRGYSR